MLSRAGRGPDDLLEKDVSHSDPYQPAWPWGCGGRTMPAGAYAPAHGDLALNLFVYAFLDPLAAL